VAQKLKKENYEICLEVTLLWPVVINETIVQQNQFIFIYFLFFDFPR